MNRRSHREQNAMNFVAAAIIVGNAGGLGWCEPVVNGHTGQEIAFRALPPYTDGQPSQFVSTNVASLGTLRSLSELLTL
jgi:hypothetical protein